MKTYLIKDAKCKVLGGPFNASVLAAVKVFDSEQEWWLTNWEYDGYPVFYQSKEDLFDKIISADESGEEDSFNELEQYIITEMEGDISLESYEAFYTSINGTEINPTAQLVRYLIALTRCDMEDLDDIINRAINKNIDDIDVPPSDFEEDDSTDDDI